MQLIVEDVVRPVTGQGLPHTVITVLLASKPTPDMVMLCPPPKLPVIRKIQRDIHMRIIFYAVRCRNLSFVYPSTCIDLSIYLSTQPSMHVDR